MYPKMTPFAPPWSTQMGPNGSKCATKSDMQTISPPRGAEGGGGRGRSIPYLCDASALNLQKLMVFSDFASTKTMRSLNQRQAAWCSPFHRYVTLQLCASHALTCTCLESQA